VLIYSFVVEIEFPPRSLTRYTLGNVFNPPGSEGGGLRNARLTELGNP